MVFFTTYVVDFTICIHLSIFGDILSVKKYIGVLFYVETPGISNVTCPAITLVSEAVEQATGSYPAYIITICFYGLNGSSLH